MTVVVIGAGSYIGARIAEAFSPGNRLFLVAREPARLQAAADGCKAAGAAGVAGIVQDLRLGIDQVTAALEGNEVDLVINAASSTSRLRDNEIASGDVEDHAMVDLLAPLRLVRRLLDKNPRRPLGIILVSSVLTLVKSPNRAIYSSLKILQEEYLRRVQAADAGVEMMVVRIAKVIPTDRDSPDTAKLAQAISSAYRQKKKEMFFGAGGVALTALFYAQPLAFRAVMKLQRALRGRA